MSELPEPLTPADCDLRGMEWMPLHGHKLYGSDFDAIASDAEYRAAQRLWWSAWQQQVPAASMPDDDRVLAHVAGYSRDPKGWAKIKAVALHAFVKCADGRLYHRFLAPEAVIAWEKRTKERERKAQYRAKKDGNTGGQNDAVPRDTTRTEPPQSADVPIPSHVDNTTQDRTGQFKKEEERKKDSPQASLVAPTEPKPKRAKNRTAIDPNWQPSERDENYAVTRIADIPATAERFRNFHTAKGSLMADWSAAWRTWVGNEPRFAPRQDAGRNGWAVLAEQAMQDRLKADLAQFDHPQIKLN